MGKRASCNEPFSVPGLVSVVLGVRDGEDEIGATLDSVTAQAGVALEVLVVDDGSGDRSAEIVARRAASDPRIRLLRQAPSGLTRALRHGCSEARGEYIARIDAGDRMLEGRLAAQLDVLTAAPEIAVLGSLTAFFGPAGERLYEDLREGDDMVDLSAGFASDRGQDLTGIPHPSVCFRRADYLAAGGYRPAFALAQDVDLWARMSAIGRIARLERVLTERRVGLDSLTPRYHRVQLQLREIAARCGAIRRAGGDDGTALAEAGRISTAALSRARRDGAGAYFIASCLARRGDHVGAEAYYRIARARDPGHMPALLALGRVHALRVGASLRGWQGIRRRHRNGS